VVDQLIFMPDYPATAKEAWSLSRYSQTVNCHYEVYQVKENEDGSAPADLSTAEPVQTEDEGE